MKKYTVAFIFNPTLEKILLIHKLRPDWQVGKLNGIGGKFKKGEHSLACVIREVKEEASLSTKKEKWVHLGNIGSDMWKVDFFTYIYEGDLSDAKSGRDEQVEWFDVKNLPPYVVPNLRWLIPLALDKLQHNEFSECSVSYYK